MAPALVLGAGAVLVWALALYVASRAPARLTPALAVVAMLGLTAYLTGEALGALVIDPERRAAWLGWTWWGQSLAAPAWLVLMLSLARDEVADAAAQRMFWPTLIVGGAIGIVFGLIGLRLVPTGDVLLAYQVFVMVCLVGAAVGFGRLWLHSPPATPLRARFGGLFVSAIVFLVGTGWLVVASGVYGLEGLPGQMALMVGMLGVGWNVARYGALLATEDVGGDAVAFTATMLAIIVGYGAIALLLLPDPTWYERALPLLLLIMTTHVVVDTRGHLLDRVIYAPLLSTMRGQLRELANRVVRQPDELAALADVRETVDQILRERSAEAATSDEPRSTELRVLVEGALRCMNDLPRLSQHPLLAELPVTASAGGTPLERAALLRNELERAIERLRPSGARPSPGSSVVGGWVHYLVLREAYVDGRPNKQIIQRYALSEGTFHRARRRAIDALAADLAVQTSAAARDD